MSAKFFPFNKKWLIASILGLLSFVVIQFFTGDYTLFEENVPAVMTRKKVEQKARFLAAENFTIPESLILRTTVTHVTDSQTKGYYGKIKKMKNYYESTAKNRPVDVYVVQIYLKNIPSPLELSIHMQSGHLVAWKNDSFFPKTYSASSKMAQKALAYASSFGYRPQDWRWIGHSEQNGFVFASLQPQIGDSKMHLLVRLPDEKQLWRGGAVTYETKLPLAFEQEIKQQEKWSEWLSLLGFFFPQFIVFGIALAYIKKIGSLTSLRRGVFLAFVFFTLYSIFTFNVLPGLRAESWTTGHSFSSMFTVFVCLTSYAFMAILTYLCAVCGDGLWIKMGYRLWPVWQEFDYGEKILKSVKEGYLLAFILLGTQSFILFILEKTIGAYSASDASQSVYNLSFPLLLPILAWCAGISEELQSRFFGIAIIRRWLFAFTKFCSGRLPSKRITRLITTLSIIPPGLLWALGHVGYAIYPIYTRLIELILISFLFGWFMLRFGLMSIIFAHIVLDTILMGIELMFDSLPGHFWGGLLSMSYPALFGIIIWKVHRSVHLQQK